MLLTDFEKNFHPYDSPKSFLYNVGHLFFKAKQEESRYYNSLTFFKDLRRNNSTFLPILDAAEKITRNLILAQEKFEKTAPRPILQTQITLHLQMPPRLPMCLIINLIDLLKFIGH